MTCKNFLVIINRNFVSKKNNSTERVNKSRPRAKRRGNKTMVDVVRTDEDERYEKFFHIDPKVLTASEKRIIAARI